MAIGQKAWSPKSFLSTDPHRADVRTGPPFRREGIYFLRRCTAGLQPGESGRRLFQVRNKIGRNVAIDALKESRKTFRFRPPEIARSRS